MKNLKKLTPNELDEQANIILYGSKKSRDIALQYEVRPEVFSLVYGKKIKIPKSRLKEPAFLVYKTPVQIGKIVCYCQECNRPRSASSGGLCRECYSKERQEKYKNYQIKLTQKIEEHKSRISMIPLYQDIASGYGEFEEKDKWRSGNREQISNPDFLENLHLDTQHHFEDHSRKERLF